ncbi:MAG: YeeE/YedE thiosulfate transporter family protein [Candidatus Omnitrophota bacterium]|nr:YeeE/YedE family protein [Candidatus Omnitrophota bacterium]MBU1928331.1 YeeE/YedE family protein [Candidatus Omnitrophota bacterium]MBU2034353.1 YeeE/YedE family protein [Candidatus Omnitrophota bacterium]
MTVGEKKGMNPYLAGALGGILAVVSLWLTGKYFGASTSFVRIAGMFERIFAPERVAKLEYFIKEAPKVEWQVMFIVGVLVGSLIAAIAAKEFCFKILPDLWEKKFGKGNLKRLIVAFIGGIIAIWGARLADGCPSGHGLSGLMQLAVSGFVALICFFIGGIVVARIIYKGGK